MGRPLKIAKAQAILTLTSTSASTDAVTVSQDLSLTPTDVGFTGVIAGMPFVVASTVGGLTAGTTYWILQITGQYTFTVSSTPLNANPTSTPVPLITAGPATVAVSVGVVDSGFQNPDTAQQSGNTSTNPGASYGVVGGNTAIYGKQVRCQVAIGVNGTGTLSASTGSATLTGVGTLFSSELSAGSAIEVAGVNLGFVSAIANNTSLTLSANAAANASGSSFVYANDEIGYIIRQKGKQKYLVKGLTSGLIGACYTANVGNTSLTPNTLNIIATYANAGTAFVQSLSDYNMEIFANDSTLPNSQPAYATFNTAYSANTYGGQPYPIVIINNA